MTSASRPKVHEVGTVLSLVAGCAIVVIELLASSLRPLSLAAGLLVVLTVSAGLTTWWRERPNRVANQILVLLLSAMAGFIALTMALAG